MGLHDRDDAPAVGAARCAEHGGDLHRVVTVVVDHRDPADDADLGEAALDAREIRQRAADHGLGKAHLAADGDRGQGVLHVVHAQHRQPHALHGAVALLHVAGDDDVEGGPQRVARDVDRPHLGLRAEPVGHDAAVLDAPDQALHLRVVDAERGDAVERNVLDEGAVGPAHRVEVAVELHVLAVDVGDDGGDGRQLDEAAVGLVGLDHHPVARAEPRVGAVGIDDAAVDDRRVQPGAVEHGGDDRGRGRLAVGAGDRHRPLEAHQLGQHLGPLHHGDVALARGDHLDVVFADGGRDDQHRHVVDDLGAVAARDGNTQGAQAAHGRALGDVAALDPVAEVVHDLGDAAHADPADADEMDRADGERHRLHAAPPAPAGAGSGAEPPIRPSTRSASARAASGRARPPAAAARRASAAGSAISVSNSRASRSGVNDGCAIMIAAPAATRARPFALW